MRFWPFYGTIHTVPREVECDAEGRFMLRGMSLRLADQPGEPLFANAEDPLYAIGVLHAGHALHIVQPVKPDRQGGEPVEVRLARGRALAGRVVDAAGAPLAGVDVWMEGERGLASDTGWARR